jgi:dihydrolipoamide dehydrogenase
MKFKLSTKVTKSEASDAGVKLTVEPSKGGAAETLDFDVVLVATGRRP